METLSFSPRRPAQAEVPLKRTLSRCPVCNKAVMADVVKTAVGEYGQVVMRRYCDVHGRYESVIASDARFYWLALGNPDNRQEGGCGCGTTCFSAGGGKGGNLGKNATDETRKGVIDQLSTCIALIEIVDSCNLACPTCFADSPVGVTESKLKYRSFEEITNRIQGVIDMKGSIEIIQFSGGEPTIHPQFFELVEWVRSNPKIDYLLINTNGVRFAKDEAFVREMGELFKKYDNIQLYLQFDGPQEEGQRELRGVDLREMRERAIRNCERIGLPITLAMTVSHDNLKYIWDAIMFALPYDNVRGVSFQPVFLSGRTTEKDRARVANELSTHELHQPVTVADIILGIDQLSNGLMSTRDFTPLPCGDPNCATIGWLLRMGGRYHSPSKNGIDVSELQKEMPDRINYNIDDLKKCGCDGTALGDLMKMLELQESNAFRISVKPFMDAWTWDEDRIDRCCTHVIRPDGKLDSFCRYYSGLTAK